MNPRAVLSVATHPFIPNSVAAIRNEMLREIGEGEIDRLFRDIPNSVRLQKPLAVPGPISEFEVRQHVEKLLERNHSTRELVSFLGGGIWEHYVPAVVDEIVGRGEFLTSYTPYQPEISQGMLQALFEYQSMICELTAMDYANSSLYDWSTALCEAARMATRVTKRTEFLVPHYMHPERLATLKTYTEPAGITLLEARQSLTTGQVILEDLERKVTERTAGVYLEIPSYLGFIETRSHEIGEIAHRRGALFLVGVEPISLGILTPPGELGADIAVGEAQPLGNYMNFGGPLVGILACKGQTLLRQMPGRIVGMTSALSSGERGFCLALQTREQHIRREKATSNICTNEALCAVAAAAYLSVLGPRGLRELAETIMGRASYAARRLAEIPGLKVPFFDAPHFNEFTLSLISPGVGVASINRSLLDKGIQGGKIVSGEFPELGETALYCVSELHTRNQIDILAESLEKIVEE